MMIQRVESTFWLPQSRHLSVFRQSTNVHIMSRGVLTLQIRERMRVGRRFLGLRPRIAAISALANALLLSSTHAPALQKGALAIALGTTVGCFFGEAWWLAGHELTERWLFVSLASTLAALGAGALLSGGLMSPLLPLLFAPIVVGIAAFAPARQGWLLLAEGGLVLLVLEGLGPLAAFPVLPKPTLEPMLLVSSLTSLALLAVGVTGLVDAHARIAAELDRLRGDMLQEAERRAASIEHLGAQVAHEVKNPLAAARGLVQLVARHQSDERDEQRLAVVVTEVDRAVAVLQDYLSFARPLSDLKLGVVPLRALFEDVVGVLEARAHDKAIELRVAADSLEVWADRQRLRDAVLNLALNAVTALQRGGRLTLGAARRGEWVELTIADDGPA